MFYLTLLLWGEGALESSHKVMEIIIIQNIICIGNPLLKIKLFVFMKTACMCDIATIHVIPLSYH